MSQVSGEYGIQPYRRNLLNISRLMIAIGVLSGTTLFASAFQNGSFENPVISPGPDFSTVPTGWVKVDPTGNGLFLELNTTFGIPFVAANGSQMYGFGGNGAQTGSLSQTFDTLLGGNYAVDFQYIVQQGNESEAMKVEVLDGSTVLASTQFTFSDRLAWASAPTLNFTATSGAATLRFTDLTGALLPGAGSDANWALDAVTVNGVGGDGTGSVPEPSTFGLVGLTTAAALVWRRMQRRSFVSRLAR